MKSQVFKICGNLLLKLLEGETPVTLSNIKEIKKLLPMLNDNIKCGNSLIDDKKYSDNKTFVWEREFKEIMDSGGFEVVIGNPPYINMQTLKDFQKYCDFSRFPNSTLLPHFIHADVWDKKTVEPLIADNSNKPLALLCDGGNKPKEMQTFTPLLSVGDFAIVHDWGNEVSDADLVGLPIEMILRQECESLKSLTRFFKRI